MVRVPSSLASPAKRPGTKYEGCTNRKEVKSRYEIVNSKTIVSKN